MIVKEEFLSRLRKIFDLNLYEVKVWTALLSRGISTAGEISDISDVPRSRTYDILQSLEKKGFIVMKLGKPIKFVALKPEEVIERVKKNVMRKAQEMVKRLDEIKTTDVMNELKTLFSQGVKYIDTTELSGAIRGRHNIYNHLDMLIRNAEKSLIIATTAEGLNRKFETLKSALEKAKRKKISIKIAAPITPKNFPVAKELSKYAEIRSGKIKGRFVLVDDKEGVYMVLDDGEVHPTYDVGIWINSPYFTSSLKHFFETQWKNMTPLEKLKIKA